MFEYDPMTCDIFRAKDDLPLGQFFGAYPFFEGNDSKLATAHATFFI